MSIQAKNKKVLIIRFSSFGDIVFAMSVLPSLKDWCGEKGIIDWLVRSDMEGVLKGQNIVTRAWSFNRANGLLGLIKLSFQIRKENYDVVYDAHCNMRSLIVRQIVCLFSKTTLVKRKKERFKRFLFFKLRINKYENWPYKGMVSFIKPLEKSLGGDWGLGAIEWQESCDAVDTSGKVVLVPSAAWDMKRWPVANWKELVNLLKNHKFIILGGPEDSFCEEIKNVAPKRIENYAGKLSLSESCAVVAKADYVITGDTGLAQVADLTARSGITLIGPTAFGFPSLETMKVMKSELRCMPCSKDGRGHCSQDIYQKCMTMLTPEMIASKVLNEFNL